MMDIAPVGAKRTEIGWLCAHRGNNQLAQGKE
jgi:hypothetical protein